MESLVVDRAFHCCVISIGIFIKMSFEWCLLLQTLFLGLTLVLQLVAAYIAYAQFKRFKKDRVKRIMDRLAQEIFKGPHPDYPRQLTNSRKIIEEELA